VIITIVSHGRTNRDVKNLAAHLLKRSGQSVRVVASQGLIPGLTLAESLADLRRISAASTRAQIGFHHLSLNPAKSWNLEQTEEAVRRVLTELGAETHAWTLVEHSDKRRASGYADAHFHLAIAHVGPEGRALRMSQSFARMEAVARTIEADFDEPITRSRRSSSVARHLKRMGRADVILALAKTSDPMTRPRSAMSSAGRQRAAREGLDLPAARAVVRAAWRSENLVSALAEDGLRLGWGDRRPIPIVRTADGAAVGALDRLAGVTRQAAIARLEAEMARPKKRKEDSHERNNESRRRKPVAGQARKEDMARRSGDEGDGGGDSGSDGAGRRIAGPRFIGSDRRQARHAAVAPDAARRRGQLALVDLWLADAIARRRARNGRTIAADVKKAKAALWRRLFGADLSPALISALCYIDVQERLIKLTNGGWVRDEGDRMLASGADPQVVAMLVAAARAKGWQSVNIWGDDNFLCEARRQFEAAGIPVTVIDPPPDCKVEPTEPPPARAPAEIVAEFQRRRASAEGRLAKIRAPAAAPPSLVAARKAEKVASEACSELRRERIARKDERDAAEMAMESAGIFDRGAARRRLNAAQAEFEAAHEAFREAFNRHDDAKAAADQLQKDFDRAERRRRIDSAIEEHKAQADANFVLECERIASESTEIAAEGREAVEAAARARLAARGGEPTQFDLGAASEDDASPSTMKR